MIERANVGFLRLALPAGRSFSPTERSLLQDAADRAALAIRRAQLHEEEHRIAVELQRGLIPKSLPEVGGIALAAPYEVAGIGVQVGGDWYDAFALPGWAARRRAWATSPAGASAAASAMGQLRTLTRAFALAEERAPQRPGEALTLLNRHQLALGDEQLFTIVYAIVDPERGHDRLGQRRAILPRSSARRPDVPLPRGRQRADGRRGQRVSRRFERPIAPERDRSCSTPTG